MSTLNGIGTTYLGYSHRNRDGSHFATKWFVLWGLSVIPLGRYRLTVGDTVLTPMGNGSRSVRPGPAIRSAPRRSPAARHDDQ